MCNANQSLLWTLLYISFIACINNRHVDGQSTSSAGIQSSATRSLTASCEDCELMLAGIPDQIDAIDTTAGWVNEGQRLIIQGTVYKLDKTTPARDVILYYYHTDKEGRYTPKPSMPAAARRHGYLRGWVKTEADGKYAIYTNRPAQYPGGQFEAHVHVIVKEPDMASPYWIDAWIFEDDPLVTPDLKARLENRGGDGVLTIRIENGVQYADHNVILGLNIPGYPK